jgi:hypothetical protein
LVQSDDRPPPPPTVGEAQTGVRRARWLVGWIFLASVLSFVGWVVGGVAYELSNPGYSPGGDAHTFDWLNSIIVSLAIVTPILGIGWVALCIVHWRQRRRSQSGYPREH